MKLSWVNYLIKMTIETSKKVIKTRTIPVKYVDTHFGIKALLTDCKKLNGEYYIKDVDCVCIGDKWYLKTEPYVAYDSETEEWTIDKSGRLIKGVVGVGLDGVFIRGLFSKNKYNNCVVYDYTGTNHQCRDYNFLDKNLYSEVLNQKIMTFTHRNHIDKFDKGLEKFNFEKQGYNIEECVDFGEKKQNYANFKTKIENSTLKISKLLGDITFGCESETDRGLFPTTIQNQLGVVICKDGSIGYSPEYVTVPYSGAKGLQSLKNFFLELDKRCSTNYTCSLHYHFGNTRKDREFIIALYKLFHDIQDELFRMLPYYKKYYKGHKKQNYSKSLSNIIPMYDKNGYKNYKEYVNKTYGELFKFLNMNNSPSPDFNRRNHHHANGNTKWNIPTR